MGAPLGWSVVGASLGCRVVGASLGANVGRAGEGEAVDSSATAAGIRSVRSETSSRVAFIVALLRRPLFSDRALVVGTNVVNCDISVSLLIVGPSVAWARGGNIVERFATKFEVDIALTKRAV